MGESILPPSRDTKRWRNPRSVTVITGIVCRARSIVALSRPQGPLSIPLLFNELQDATLAIFVLLPSGWDVI